MPQVDPSMAQAIIQRMGETGQPPDRGTLAVNIGTEGVLDILRQEYLVPMRESGRNSSFKLVEAPFGGGKTHFLFCLREIGWQEGFVTSLVDVSPQECPFDDTVSVYKAVARNLELPPDDPNAVPDRGIDAVLIGLVRDRVKQNGKEVFQEWLVDEFRRAQVESHAVRRAAFLFMQSILDRDFELEELMGAFLRGEAVSKGELSTNQVREELESRTAFRFLRSLIQVLRALDIPGVILLFDEMDRVMSLSVKRRKSIGDNLRQMIDHCGQATLPALLWVYAVPPEFRTTVVPEYPALEQRLRGAGSFSATSPLEPVIDLNDLPLDAEQLFQSIGMRLFDLFQIWRGDQLDAEIQTHNMEVLARHMGRDALEVGSRRLFVKQAVHLLHAQLAKEARLEAGEIDKMADSFGDDDLLEGEEDIF
ncbi:MAG: hypothetical protein ACI841_000759 [Planctomycetota bacterium]|jgi:hypothetical protein